MADVFHEGERVRDRHSGALGRISGVATRKSYIAPQGLTETPEYEVSFAAEDDLPARKLTYHGAGELEKVDFFCVGDRVRDEFSQVSGVVSFVEEKENYFSAGTDKLRVYEVTVEGHPEQKLTYYGSSNLKGIEL